MPINALKRELKELPRDNITIAFDQMREDLEGDFNRPVLWTQMLAEDDGQKSLAGLTDAMRIICEDITHKSRYETIALVAGTAMASVVIFDAAPEALKTELKNMDEEALTTAFASTVSQLMDSPEHVHEIEATMAEYPALGHIGIKMTEFQPLINRTAKPPEYAEYISGLLVQGAMAVPIGLKKMIDTAELNSIPTEQP